MARDCPTRMVLHLQNYYDADASALAYRSMEAGTAAHLAFAAWLKGENWVEAIEYYRDYTAEHSMVDDRRGYDNLYNVLSAVFDRHPINELPFRVDKPEYVEIPFACPLGEVEVGGEKIEVDLIGQIDGLPIDRQTGGRWVLEHKTTGKLDSGYIWRFVNTDPQTTGYIWAVQQTLGEKVENCWVNAVQLTQMPTSERKCKDHGVQYLECGPEHVKQTFVPVKRTPEQLEEFRVNALLVAKDAIRAAKFGERLGKRASQRSPRIGQFTRACENCDYRRWCITGNRNPDMMDTILTQRPMVTERLRTGFAK